MPTIGRPICAIRCGSAQAVAAAGADHAMFVEVSPHPLLTYAINDTLADVHHHSIGTLQRDTARHVDVPHQPQRHPHHPPAAAAEHPPEPHPGDPHHPLAPHPALDHPTAGAPEVQVHDGIQGQTSSHASAGSVDSTTGSTRSACPISELTTDAASGNDECTWLVLADADLGTELASLLGANSRASAPSALDQDGGSGAPLDALTGVDQVLFAPSVASAHFDVASAYRLFNAVTRLAATTCRNDVAAQADRPDPQCPTHRVKVTGRTRHMRSCGVWAARSRWSTRNSGAASSMSTNRCRRS